jgi:FMN phosphatase YigB (HAD superfamily)
MRITADVVFLLDVDNTLLDTDSFLIDLHHHLATELAAESVEQYWAIFEAQRKQLGYADYLGALQRHRLDNLHDAQLLLISSFLIDYPYADRLFPGALSVIKHLRALGPTVVLSDGDAVLQPRKIQRSGLWDAVDGCVLIYVHKEQMLDVVAKQYPARHYVMVDDKLLILTAMKAIWRDRLTTVFPRQGHYAHDSKHTFAYPPADLTVECIGELLNVDFPIGHSTFQTNTFLWELP